MENNIQQMKLKLAQKEKENQDLLNILKNKENDTAMLQGQLSNTTSNNEHRQINSSNILNYAELNEEIEELKNEIQEKNNQIEKLENEINNIKLINNQFLKQHNEYKKIQIMNNESGSGGEEKNALDNLRKELKDKNLEIEKLIKENYNLKNNIQKSNAIIEEDEKEVNNNIQKKQSDNNLIRKSVNSLPLNEIEKNKLLLEEIKELKTINESDMIQIKTLKADIKELKEKLKKMETFSGQLKNYDDYISLLNKALFDYKPKKKEQKEALNKLVEVMNNHRI
jgi:predicted RNase H-like nuclease (RuvC/YqgF family)